MTTTIQTSCEVEPVIKLRISSIFATDDPVGLQNQAESSAFDSGLSFHHIKSENDFVHIRESFENGGVVFVEEIRDFSSSVMSIAQLMLEPSLNKRKLFNKTIRGLFSQCEIARHPDFVLLVGYNTNLSAPISRIDPIAWIMTHVPVYSLLKKNAEEAS